jgi:hypothetical protein
LTGDQITPENRALRNTLRKVRKLFVERWADENGDLWVPPPKSGMKPVGNPEGLHKAAWETCLTPVVPEPKRKDDPKTKDINLYGVPL